MTMSKEYEDSSLADITERLFGQFEGHIPLTEIVAVVRQARIDLTGSPQSALPELIERLAWYRLRAASGDYDQDDESG